MASRMPALTSETSRCSSSSELNFFPRPHWKSTSFSIEMVSFSIYSFSNRFNGMASRLTRLECIFDVTKDTYRSLVSICGKWGGISFLGVLQIPLLVCHHLLPSCRFQLKSSHHSSKYLSIGKSQLMS